MGSDVRRDTHHLNGTVRSKWVWFLVLGAVLFLGGVLAVMLTRPARSWWRAMMEALIAAVIAGSGAVAVAGFEADVLTQRYNLAVHILALILTISVVWGLGAGLHGLGRRGFATILGAAESTFDESAPHAMSRTCVPCARRRRTCP